MQVSFDKPIKGNQGGKFLYTFTTVDESEPEDTTTEFWQGDTEDEVIDLIQIESCGQNEENIERFEEELGTTLLIEQVGRINT